MAIFRPKLRRSRRIRVAVIVVSIFVVWQVYEFLTYDPVLAYLRDAERICLEEFAHENRPEGYYCPCLPNEFYGLQIVNASTQHWEWSDIFLVTGANWMLGGEWKPADCVARYHMAVIIPFRDRDINLRALLRHLIPVLQRQFLHFRIFVVEQNSPAVFNKASMMNVGFLEASRLFPEMNCVMFQDADSLAEDDRLLMRCDSRPHHYALLLSRWAYKMSYFGQFGGAVTFRPELFRRIDGYSIMYFGWGAEDDDMGRRVKYGLGEVFRPPMELCRYATLPHDPGGSNPRNRKRVSLLQRNKLRYFYGMIEGGMSEMSYTLERSIERRSFYTYILANLNVTRLPYPNHAQSSYTKQTGVCAERFYYDRLTEVSAVTCRYLCDTAPTNTPCYGFTYYVITPEDARLGKTVSKCRFLTGNCNATRQEREAFTYVQKRTEPSLAYNATPCMQTRALRKY